MVPSPSHPAPPPHVSSTLTNDQVVLIMRNTPFVATMHSIIFEHVFDVVCVDKRIVDGNNLDEKILFRKGRMNLPRTVRGRGERP